MYNPFNDKDKVHFPSFFEAFTSTNENHEESQVFQELSFNLDSRLTNKPIPEDIQKSFFDLKRNETQNLVHDPENLSNSFALTKDHSPTYEIQRKIRRKLRAQHELKRKQRKEKEKSHEDALSQNTTKKSNNSTPSKDSYSNPQEENAYLDNVYTKKKSSSSKSQKADMSIEEGYIPLHNQVEIQVEAQSDAHDSDMEDECTREHPFSTPTRSPFQHSPYVGQTPMTSQSYRYATQFYNNKTVLDPQLLRSPPSRIILYDPSNDSPKMASDGKSVTRSIQTNLTIAPHLTVKITVLSDEITYNSSSIDGMEEQLQDDNYSHETFDSPSFKDAGIRMLSDTFQQPQFSPFPQQMSPSNMFSPNSMKPPTGKSTHNPYFSPIGKEGSIHFGVPPNPAFLQSPLLSPIHSKTPTNRFMEQNQFQEFTPTKNSSNLHNNYVEDEEIPLEMNDPQLFLSPILSMKKNDETLLNSPSTPSQKKVSGLVAFGGRNRSVSTKKNKTKKTSQAKQQNDKEDIDELMEDSLTEPFLSPIAPNSKHKSKIHTTNHSQNSSRMEDDSKNISNAQEHSKEHKNNSKHEHRSSSRHNDRNNSKERMKVSWNDALNATPEVHATSFISPVKSFINEEMSDIQNEDTERHIHNARGGDGRGQSYMQDIEYTGHDNDQAHHSHHSRHSHHTRDISQSFKRNGSYESRENYSNRFIDERNPNIETYTNYPPSPSFVSPVKESPFINNIINHQDFPEHPIRRDVHSDIVRQLDFQNELEEQSSYHMSSDISSKIHPSFNGNHGVSMSYVSQNSEHRHPNQYNTQYGEFSNQNIPSHPQSNHTQGDTLRSWKQYDPMEAQRFNMKNAPYINESNYWQSNREASTVPEFISPVKMGDLTSVNQSTQHSIYPNYPPHARYQDMLYGKESQEYLPQHYEREKYQNYDSHFDRENYPKYDSRRSEHNSHSMPVHGGTRYSPTFEGGISSSSTNSRLPITRANATAMYAITTPIRSPLSPINYSYIKSKILSPI